jgi:hypothetical protein
MNMFENVSAEADKKEFSEDELFKIALRYIESGVNHGDRTEKADSIKKLAGQEGSYMEESIKKAREMVANGKAEEIARQEYKGGIETPKSDEEKFSSWN